jgi:hypothetical protein
VAGAVGRFALDGLELVEEAKPVGPANRPVEAVLDPPLVDEEPVKHSRAGEVLDRDPPEVQFVIVRFDRVVPKSFWQSGPAHAVLEVVNGATGLFG